LEYILYKFEVKQEAFESAWVLYHHSNVLLCILKKKNSLNTQ